MDALTIFLYTSVFAVVLWYIYRYLMKPFTYWEKRGIKSTPAVPIIGSLHEIFAQDFHNVVLERYRKHGRVHGTYEGTSPVITVGEPDLLRDILVKDFHVFPNRRSFSTGSPVIDKMMSSMKSEEWKRVRAIISPAFTSGKIKMKFSVIADAADIALKNIQKCAESGQPADCKKLFGTFTMDVIARTAFGTMIDSHDDPENEFLKHARLAFRMDLSFKLLIFFLMPKLSNFLGISVFSWTAQNFFKDAASKFIENRRETGQILQRHNDLLQLLMDAVDEATQDEIAASNEETDEDGKLKSVNDLGPDHQNKQIFQPTKKGKGLSHDQVMAQCVLFFLAGYDSSATTLSFASYMLALNLQCQEILIREIDETLQKNQGKLTQESVQNMKYLDNVISETLRMFPPVISTDREAVEDYELGSTGIKIKKGMVVTIPIYAIHYDPEYYEHPEKFNPDRFNPEEKNMRHAYSYMPFGLGPRNCIGMRLGLIEVKFCLATLLSKFRVKPCAETKVPPEFYFGQGLMQPKAILLKVERRNDCVI